MNLNNNNNKKTSNLNRQDLFMTNSVNTQQQPNQINSLQQVN